MAQPKSFYLDGKRYRLDPRVPASFIQWVVGQLHVGDTDAEVEAEIRRRCEGNAGWTPALTDQAIRYALRCHRKNQALLSRMRL